MPRCGLVFVSDETLFSFGSVSIVVNLLVINGMPEVQC